VTALYQECADAVQLARSLGRGSSPLGCASVVRAATTAELEGARRSGQSGYPEGPPRPRLVVGGVIIALADELSTKAHGHPSSRDTVRGVPLSSPL
jgi:hypothetical protein